MGADPAPPLLPAESLASEVVAVVVVELLLLLLLLLLLKVCDVVEGSTQNPWLTRAAWPQCASRSAMLLASCANPMCVIRHSYVFPVVSPGSPARKARRVL